MTDKKLAVKDSKLKAFFKESMVLTEDVFKPQISLPILRLVQLKPGEKAIIKDNKQFKVLDEKEVPLYSFYHGD